LGSSSAAGPGFVSVCAFRLVALAGARVLTRSTRAGHTADRLIPQPVAALLPTFLTPAQASIDAPGASRRREPAALRFLRSLEALTDARSSSSVGARDPPNTNGTDAGASKEQRDSDAEELELPDFHTGGYKEALEQAKRQGRIVLIGLFSDIHQDDAQWKRTVLTDPLLVNTLRKHNVVFWAGDVKDREPYQVTRLLPPTTFPSLTFISLLPSSRGSGSSSSGSMKLSVLSRHEGPTVTAAELTTHLEQSIVPRTTAILNRIQRETRQREEERRLRQEQDRAFEDSQTRDVARILKLREERAQQEALERAEADRKRELELAKQRAEAQARVRLAYLRFARSTLLPTEPPLDDTLASSIALRLPPTPRPFKRRFPASTPLEVLYLWADTLTIPADLPAAGDPAEPPTDSDLAGQPYRHEFAFKLATSYPRRVLDTSDGDGTIGGSPILKAGAGVLVFEATEGSGSHAADDDDDSSDDDEDEA
jgi:FAS-associated factor 2